MLQRLDKERSPGRALDLRLVPTALLLWSGTATGLHSLIVTAFFSAGCAVFLVAIWALSSGFLFSKRWYMSAVNTARLRRFCYTAALPVAALANTTAITWVRRQAVERHELARSIGKVATTEFTLATTPEQTQFGSHASAYVSGLPGQVRVFGGEELLAFDRGTVLRAHAAVKESDLVSLNRLQVSVRGTPEIISHPNPVVDSVRSGLREAAQALWPGADKLLPAMTLGDERLFTLTDRAVLTESGLSHLSAVSGANIALILGAVMTVLSWASPRARVIAATVVLAGFIALVGAEPSVLRAMLTGSVALLAIITGRTNNAFTALMAGVIGLVIAVPDLAVSVGFMLSVVATAGLVLLAEPFALRLKRIGLIGRWPAPVVRAISVAIVAHCVTTPVLAISLQSFAPWAVLANLCAAPAVAPVTILGTLSAFFIAVSLPAVATVLMWAAAPFAWWIYYVAEKVAMLPGGGSATQSGSTVGFRAAASSGTEGAWLSVAVVGTELVFIVMWLWPQIMFRLGVISGIVAGVVGAVVISFGLHIPRAPDGWVLAACASEQGRAESEIMVFRSTETPSLADDTLDALQPAQSQPARLSRECAIALGISKDKDRKQVLVAQSVGGNSETEPREAEAVVVDNPEDAERLLEGAQTNFRQNQQDSPRLIIARDCRAEQGAKILSPDGTSIVCPARDGPQALYPSGAVWRGGR